MFSSRRLVAAAAALALLVACSSSDPEAAPVTSGPTATTGAETSPPPAEDETATFPIGGFPAGIPVEPGTYRPHPGFDVQFTVELGEGWRSIRDEVLGVISLVTDETNGIGHATHWLSFFPAPPDTRPQDLLDRIESQQNIVPGPPREVTIGDVTGTQVEARAEPNPTEAGDDETEAGTLVVGVATDLIVGAFWASESPEARFRFIVLDVGGRTLLVYVEAPPDEFDAFAARAEEALAGLTFEI